MIRLANNLQNLMAKEAEPKREASKEKSLHDWFSRKGEKGSKGGWVDCNAPDGSGGYKACGRSSGEERGEYPACRPTPGACKEKGRGDSWGKKSEEEKKKDDACTRKVKARYDVWPSAYASGAVTRCRAVGAANWGEGESKKDAADKWLGAAKGLIIGHLGGRLLGAAVPNSLEKPSLGITAGQWNSRGSGAGGLLGALLGGGLGYAMTDEDDDKETDSKKKKTKKKASSSESISDAPILCTPGFGCKRFFTPTEAMEVAAAKENIMPTLFRSKADPIYTQISSPAWAAAGKGLLGALFGGGLGYAAGTLADGYGPLGSLAGATLGGTAGALSGYLNKLKKNKELEALITELPVGADLGDVELYSDPKIKQQLARDLQRQLMRQGLI